LESGELIDRGVDFDVCIAKERKFGASPSEEEIVRGTAEGYRCALFSSSPSGEFLLWICAIVVPQRDLSNLEGKTRH